MVREKESIAEFFVLLLARAVEPQHILKWIAEISFVINKMGGKALIPARIGRPEPFLRRHGAQVLDEPLDEERKRGALKRLRALSIERDVSAYIAFDTQTVRMAQTLKTSHFAPIIYLCQEEFPKPNLFGIGARIPDLDKIDHFIVPSQTLSDHLMTAHKIEKKRVSIIYEGFDLDQFAQNPVPHERTVSLANSWGVIENVVEIVLIPQEFSSAKWSKNLISLMQEWQNHPRKDIQFVVVGDDDGSGKMEQLRSQLLKLAPNAPIQLAGYCADIEAAILLSSLVLILEGESKMSYPMALLSQALGRFVILNDTQVASEFVDDGNSGKILPPVARNIADEIERINDWSDDTRSFHSQLGRAFIYRKFTRNTMHENLRHLFDDDEDE